MSNLNGLEFAVGFIIGWILVVGIVYLSGRR